MGTPTTLEFSPDPIELSRRVMDYVPGTILAEMNEPTGMADLRAEFRKHNASGMAKAFGPEILEAIMITKDPDKRRELSSLFVMLISQLYSTDLLRADEHPNFVDSLNERVTVVPDKYNLKFSRFTRNALIAVNNLFLEINIRSGRSPVGVPFPEFLPPVPVEPEKPEKQKGRRKPPAPGAGSGSSAA